MNSDQEAQINLLDETTAADDQVGEGFVPFGLGQPMSHSHTTRVTLPGSAASPGNGSTVVIKTTVNGGDIVTEATVDGTPETEQEYQAVVDLLQSLLS